MAITRSQIARQLLAEGGAPRIPFRNGGGRTDADTMSGSGYGAGSSSSNDGFGGGDDVQRDTYSQQLATLQDPMDKPGTTGDTFPGLSKVTPRNVFGVSADNPMLQRSLFERAMIQSIPGIGGLINLGEMNAFNLPQFRYSNTGGMDNRFNTTDDDDNNQIVRPMMPMVPKLPTDIEPEKSDYTEFVQRFSLPEQYRLADGGEVRQAYGLGSIVKKVTGAVKKVVKSPVGKAALAGAAVYGLGGGTFFGKTLPGVTRGGQGFGGFGGLSSVFGNVGDIIGGKGLGDKFAKAAGSNIGLGILGTSLAAGILTPEQEEEAESLTGRIVDKTGIDVAAIRKEVQEAYANNTVGSLKNKYPFLITQSAAAAEGGRIGFAEGTQGDEIIEEEGLPRLRNMPEFKGDEVKPSDMMMASNIENDAILENLFEKYLDMGLSPEDAAIKAREEFDRMSKAKEPDRMMANEGGLMNLGGNEMDLRGGGFVPLGVAEKADDVPARLSKNEFVFTADAVRAAGGGSVDRGADLMYKTMKQLENKVA